MVTTKKMKMKVLKLMVLKLNASEWENTGNSCGAESLYSWLRKLFFLHLFHRFGQF
jgi:hypothetical protein